MDDIGSWLIIGGSGYLGRNLVRSIRRRFPYDQITSPGRADLVEFRAQPNKLLARLDGHLNVVILAGAGVTSKIDEHGIEFNERWVPEIAASIGLLPNVEVLVAGSSFEYGTSGEVDNLLDPVSSQLKPTEAYGISKKNGFLALQLKMHHGLKVGYARIFQVWGGDEHPSRLAPMLLANAANGIVTTLNSGGAVRDFVHVNEVTDQIIDYFLKVDFYPRVFNICSGVPTTVQMFSAVLLNSNNFNSGLLLETSDSGSHPYKRLVGLRQPLLGSKSVREL